MYKILVTARRGQDGGLSMIVIEFASIEQAEDAATRILAGHDSMVTYTVMKLF